MGPSQQFKSAILGLLQNSPKTISSQDLIKHNGQATTYYIISSMVFKNNQLQKSTDPFSEKGLLEVSRAADKVKVPYEVFSYNRSSAIELLNHQGKNFIAWVATDGFGRDVTIVKIISPDGVTQIKVISKDQTEQVIFNVCELPSYLLSQL
jgi:hypothetical protein